MIILPNGIGEITGDSLVTARPFQATGNVYYVSSVSGDGTSSGLNKSRPMSTLSQALTAASNGDVIVLLDGHTEVLAAGITISKNVTIVASGSSSGVPTVSFQASGSGYALFTVTAAGVQLRNIRFRGRAVSEASAANLLISGVADVSVIGCYFDCSANDLGGAIQVAVSTVGFRCENSTFVATNTSVNPAAGPGINVTGTTTDLRLIGVVFDGGSKGFASGYAYVELGAPTRRYAEQISMLRGADALLSASGVQSYWSPTVSSADARIST